MVAPLAKDVTTPPSPLGLGGAPPQRWSWPADLKTIGVTPEDQRALERVLRSIIPRLPSYKSAVEGEAHIIEFHPSQTGKQTKGPLERFLFVTTPSSQGEKLRRVLLKTKIRISNEPERKVKVCYDLVSGGEYVRKRCSLFEREILNEFRKRRSRGIEPVLWFRGTEKKTESIHRRCPGTLEFLYGEGLMAFAQKLSLIEDLLCGMAFLHGLVCSVESERDGCFLLRGFHRDIKPSNILVSKSSKTGRWKAYISDFGLACRTDACNFGTPGFRPPEAVAIDYDCTRQLQDEKPMEEIERGVTRHYLEHGQAFDIWSMGLILVIILVGHSSIDEEYHLRYLPSLPSLVDKIRRSESALLERLPPDLYVKDLSQEEILRDLLHLEQATSARLSESDAACASRIWKLVGSMLQVAPERRISAAAALAAIKT